jgi:DNA-binding transcriptional ArsR family regulator
LPSFPAVVIYNHMVVDDAPRKEDRVFHALADPTRRDILERAMRGEHSISALARCYPISFAAVHKHVAALERAELVTKRRRGREQLVCSNIETIRLARRMLDRFEVLWRDRLEQFGELLAERDEGEIP